MGKKRNEFYESGTSEKPAWKMPLIIAIIFSVMTVLDLLIRASDYLAFEALAASIAWIIFAVKKGSKETGSDTIGDWIRSNVESTRKAGPDSYANTRSHITPMSVTSSISPAPSPESYMENNTINIMDKASFSCDSSRVSFGDGRVVCHFLSGDAVIGYYEIDSVSADKTRVIVQAVYDKREIGNFEYVRDDWSCLIFLSNLGWYRVNNAYKKGTKPFTLLAAEMWIWKNSPYMTGIIEDMDTGEKIAEYKGDPIGAAAAFVCMYYEVSGCGKYHDFFWGA